MAAAHQKEHVSPSSRRRTPSDLPVVAACGALVAACMVVTAVSMPADQSEVVDSTPAPAAQSQEQQPEVADGEVIGHYQAISQSTDANRAENLRVAAETLDGAVIEPGETFSFNERIGDVEQDPRYRNAAVIEGGEMVSGSGGGICQVSTALYIAALKADLEIVERHPHSVASDYAPIGLDATLVYGVMDLRIRNAGDAPVRIKASAVGQTVEVSIIGEPLGDGVTIDATSNVIDQYVDGTGPDAQLHYVAEAYRVYYLDGVKQYSDLMHTDTYLVHHPSAVILSEGSVEATK